MRKQFLFIGIGGMGMGPLALYLKQQGSIVYGYDDALSNEASYFFEEQEIVICAVFPEQVDTVVYSSAIAADHPWLLEAKKRGLTIIRRGNLLAQISQQKRMIAVTGSHGKTTITGLLTDYLPDCDYILGGFFQRHQKLPARFKKGQPYIICEVDESDHTIEHYVPYVTVALNLEDDHLPNYGNSEALDHAFEILFQKTHHAIIIPDEDLRLKRILQSEQESSLKSKIVPWNNESTGKVARSPINTENLLKALRGELTEVQFARNAKITPIFRRHQYLGQLQGVDLWADYAHHPTEVLYCMQRYEKKYKAPLFIFQPHRYTRTQQYAETFAQILASRCVFLLPVYAAGENFLENGCSETIFRYLPKNSKIRLIKKLEDLSLEDCLNELQKSQNTPEENSGQLPDRSKKNSENLITSQGAIIFIGAGGIFNEAQNWTRLEKEKQIELFLKKKEIPYQKNCQANRYSTFHPSGILHLLIEPRDESELEELIQIFYQQHLPYRVLGNGSNFLLDNDRCIFLSLHSLPQYFLINDLSVTVSANTPFPYFCHELAKSGIAGCEQLAGIPGTIGGALYMNAGAHQQSIFDYLAAIDVINDQGTRITVNKEDISFAYRKGFHGKGVLLQAHFQFKEHVSKEELLASIKEVQQWRREHQPHEPNLGCIFKNPLNFSAGKLIDQANLKRICHGGAKISEKHANFIVNATGTATSEDFKFLLKLCRQKVFENTEIFLKREILFASDFT